MTPTFLQSLQIVDCVGRVDCVTHATHCAMFAETPLCPGALCMAKRRKPPKRDAVARVSSSVPRDLQGFGGVATPSCHKL